MNMQERDLELRLRPFMEVLASFEDSMLCLLGLHEAEVRLVEVGR